MTISCSKNFMRHGLLAKCTFGTRDFKRETKADNNGRRGKMELTATSNGPGTKTKCVVRVISGYDAIKSARVSKLSAGTEVSHGVVEQQTHHTLEFSCLSAVALRNPSTAKIATKHHHFWNEAVLHAVVEHLA